MVAELARGDYEDLVADGLKPTLDDFDRLNQLALRLEDGPETTPANHPRIGWAGDVPFHEPTACAIMWLKDYAERVPSDAETQQSFFFFACAHAKDPSAFDGLETPKDIEKAVKKWLRSVPCTVSEMARACHYAAWGYADAVPALSPMKLEHLRRKGKTVAVANLENLERVVAEAAGTTGLSYFDIMAQTPSRLNAMVVASAIEAGARVTKDTAKLQVDYASTLNEIRTRLEKERAEKEEQSDG